MLTTALDRAEKDENDAVAAYTDALQQQPDLVAAYSLRGNAYHREGQFKKAVEDFNIVLRHEPRNAAAYFARGQSWQAQGNSRRALSSYSLAIAVEPRQARWYYLRGVAYDGLAGEADAAGKSARAKQLRDRAKDNYAKARLLDPITDFSKQGQVRE